MRTTLPRLIATDLDGTLLDPTGTITERAVAALTAAADAGIVVVFASGRPPAVAHREIAAVGAALAYGVMANGAIVCRLPSGETLRNLVFPTADAIAAARLLRQADPEFGFALASDRHFAAEHGFAARMPVHPGEREVDDALVGHDGSDNAIKLLVFHQRFGATELLDIIPTIVGTALVPTHMGAEAVELGPAGADKGTGLTWLCNFLDIAAEDVLVFGDETNDVAMLAMAGRAVAVSNAVPAVREIADEVCGSNADDGVAAYIEALLAGR